MLSAGMLTDLASATMVRRRGFMSGSPPPLRAATVSSLMSRVKILPRFASAAPFLCLIVCHFEWPDMAETPANTRNPDRASYHATHMKLLPILGCNVEPFERGPHPGRSRGTNERKGLLLLAARPNFRAEENSTKGQERQRAR